jgi:hypothetical protein
MNWRQSTVIVAGCVRLVAACGGSSASDDGASGSAAGSGGTAAASAGTLGVSGLTIAMQTTSGVYVQALNDPMCMPRALVVNAAGESPCFIAEGAGLAFCSALAVCHWMPAR